FKPCGNSDYEIEKQMQEFLKFCLEEDVPILAHCSFSQYVKKAEGACAAPEAWEVFLKQSGHEKLRLNLGHCGGPWDLGPNSETNTIWTETVIKLLEKTNDYPQLYADLGDDSWILNPYSAANQELMTKLKCVLNDNQNAKARLLYGSDWSLL